MTTKNASATYQKMSQIDHVKKRSGLYIGSIANEEGNRFVVSEDDLNKKCIIKRLIKFNGGLEQCVLELLTNATDHSLRPLDKVPEPVTKININIDKQSITVYNNGTGIPIEIHNQHKIYIGELIFGNLLTSSNYDDDEKRLVTGVNGIGCKAANIFSTKFEIELATNGQLYKQTFKDGMTNKTEPVIKSTKSKDYVQITYYPDFKAFGMTEFTDDMIKIIEKRCYDASAITSKKVVFTFNDEKICIKDFKDYMNLFLEEETKKIYHESTDGRWSIGVALNPFDDPMQVSFVNSVSTEQNGSHVNYIMDQITRKVIEEMNKNATVKKENITIKPQYIKDNIILFVRCLIENPSYDSQTKTKLKTSVADFGSKCVIPDDVIGKIIKLGLLENVLNIARAKDLNAMKKATSSSSKSGRVNIPKLEDALWASKKPELCTLIVTEGDSGKATVMQGLTVVGNERYGAFPLRGKLLNVRSATIKQLGSNEELININKILGLSHGDKDKSKLRYHRVMICADQDSDAYHIKGLLMNYFSFFWPEIIKDDFISTLLTPIVKVSLKNNEFKDFYNLYDFEEWGKVNKNLINDQKYYKGLGTSNKEESKEYFKNLSKNQIKYTFDQKTDLPKLELAFDKKKANARKDWISESIIRLNEKGSQIDYTKKSVSISSFIDNELVMFSIYDCKRSIPNVIDGLKVSQRKVLYGSINKKIFKKKDQIKVAQLGSYISELTEYHHGEVSLHETIVNLCQNFVSCGNAPVLVPEGQFGTRSVGGKDSASPRYIHTYLKEWVPIMYNEMEAKHLLKYTFEDAKQTEPEMYIPTLPMLLLNGAKGIGTGWSCDVPCFAPKEIINILKDALIDPSKASKVIKKQSKNLSPWYRNFKGQITNVSKNKWVSKGLYQINGKKVIIKDIPIDIWYEDLKEILKKLEDEGTLKYKDKPITDPNGEDYIEFEITLSNVMEEAEIVKILHLEKNINATNMVCFDHKGAIKKYDSATEILLEFYEVRFELYVKRKALLIDILEKKLLHISEKVRFITMVIRKELIIDNKKNEILEEEMRGLKFTIIDELLSMHLRSLTKEKVEELMKNMDIAKMELENLKKKEPKDLWLEDINALEKFKEFT